MHENQYCTRLNLPDAVTDHSILTLRDSIPFNISADLLNPEVLDILKSKGFGIDSVEIFKAGPGNPMLPIHIDDSPFLNGGYVHEDIGKLNWIYGNLDCNMTWFKERAANVRKNGVNSFTPYVGFDEKDVEPIANINIGRNAVIQAAIPHTVINNSDVFWYCLGIHLSYEGFTRVPYQFMVDKLKEYVLPQ